MKTTVKSLKKALFEALREDLDRERRQNYGYNESDADVDYGDLPENYELDDSETEEEGYDLGGMEKEEEGYDLGGMEKEEEGYDLDDMEKEEEGVSQSKRSVAGYDLEGPTDYDVAETLALKEVAPPGMEDLALKMKSRVGKTITKGPRKGETFSKQDLYKTLWAIHGDKNEDREVEDDTLLFKNVLPEND